MTFYIYMEVNKNTNKEYKITKSAKKHISKILKRNHSLLVKLKNL